MPIVRRSSQSAEPVLTEDEVQESYWPSPSEVVVPKLRRHLTGQRYGEPCAGNGKLIKHMQDFAKCIWASDICPRHSAVTERCALTLTPEAIGTDLLVTNPPFNSKFVYPFLDHALHVGFTLWLFLPGDFAYRRSAGYVMPFCERILAVGQVKFIEDSPSKGETQFAWFRFTPIRNRRGIIFEHREPTFNAKIVPSRLKERR